jgi:RNA polymerase sigma-70 factor, ECF subfamily
MADVEMALPISAASSSAFSDVFRENAPFAWRCLRRLGVSAADADDVCQEVFLVVHRRLSEYDGRATMRGWIYGICVRKASDHRRLSHKRHESPTDAVPEQIGEAPQPRDLERKRAIEALDAALNELDEDKRATFVLFEIEGLPMQEIATVLGCPLQTAYSRLHAARKSIEALIRRNQGDEPTRSI